MRTKPLLALALLATSLLAGSALAQPAPPLAPPSGPIVQGQPADPYGQAGPDARQRGRGGHRRIAPALRAMLLARFDRDGDGRLTGPERRAAKRFVVRHRRQIRQAMNGGMGRRGGGGRRGGMGGGGMGGAGGGF